MPNDGCVKSSLIYVQHHEVDNMELEELGHFCDKACSYRHDELESAIELNHRLDKAVPESWISALDGMKKTLMRRENEHV